MELVEILTLIVLVLDTLAIGLLLWLGWKARELKDK